MSNVIFIESGQCGNQVGFDILKNLYNNIESRETASDQDDGFDVFFRSKSKHGANKHVARAVCLDTEPKVIQQCLAYNGAWNIDHKSVAYRHGGAGNNWAAGFSMY